MGTYNRVLNSPRRPIGTNWRATGVLPRTRTTSTRAPGRMGRTFPHATAFPKSSTCPRPTVTTALTRIRTAGLFAPFHWAWSQMVLRGTNEALYLPSALVVGRANTCPFWSMRVTVWPRWRGVTCPYAVVERPNLSVVGVAASAVPSRHIFGVPGLKSQNRRAWVGCPGAGLATVHALPHRTLAAEAPLSGRHRRGRGSRGL